jgi:hypothetical protein
MNDVDEVSVEIASHLGGHITPRGLIEPRGTIELKTNYAHVGGSNSGHFCKVVSREYQLEIGCTETHFYIMRNADRLEVPIRPIHRLTGSVHILAGWDLTQLSLTVLDDTFTEAIAGLQNNEDKVREVQNRQTFLVTVPTIPPNSLLKWARKQAVLPTETYNSVSHFNEIVASSLEAIADPVSSMGSINSFWDITYQGRAIVGRQPKREVDIHPTVHNLLFYIAIAKNLEVTPEYPIAGGRLDFLISAPLADGNTANACIEFKHAHSHDVLDGLLHQLPTYMRAKGCDFGVYCVLYFKGPHFDEPRDHDLVGLRILLEKKKRAAGLGNIRTLMFDFSRREAPSKL